MSFCILSSPLLCASRDFSSGSSAFSPLFMRLPLLSLFLRCLQLLHLFLRWLRPPPLASLLLSLCLLPRGSWYLRSPFRRCLDWVGGLYTLSSAQVLPQAPIGVSSLSTASPLLSVPHPAVPSSSLPAFQPHGVSGFYPPASSLLPSFSLMWPVSSAPGLGSPLRVSVVPCLPAVLYLPLRYFLLPLFALLLLAPLQLSMALPLRCLVLLRLLVYLQFCSWALQGFQRPLLLLLFALLLLPPLRVSLALPLRFPGLLRLLVSLQFAPGFSAASSLTPFFLRCSCCLRCGSLCFPSASAGSFIDFVGYTPQPGFAQAYAPLSGTSTAQVATGAVAPVPEAFVPHLCLPPLTLVSALMVAILTLAASSSQAPLPTYSFSWSSS